MFGQFDNQSIKKFAPAEFDRLKQLMTQLEGEPHKSEFFNWTAPDSGDALLKLGTVAAQFMMKKGRYFVEFCGLPSYTQSADRPETETWELRPDIYEGKFIWMLGQEANTPEQLAKAIALRVTEFYDAYDEAVGL